MVIQATIPLSSLSRCSTGIGTLSRGKTMPSKVKQVPYVDLAGQHRPLKGELLEAIGHVFDRGQFILGDEVEVLEQRFAKMCGVRFAVAVNSGTDGLILALQALGISKGDAGQVTLDGIFPVA